jgi:hypothetical protein
MQIVSVVDELGHDGRRLISGTLDLDLDLDICFS